MFLKSGELRWSDEMGLGEEQEEAQGGGGGGDRSALSEGGDCRCKIPEYNTLLVGNMKDGLGGGRSAAATA